MAHARVVMINLYDYPWIGPDCSEMECPRGRAWFDEASSTDEAHADNVCSNAGLCNRKNGHCDCDFRFEGDACEIEVSNKGFRVSMWWK